LAGPFAWRNPFSATPPDLWQPWKDLPGIPSFPSITILSRIPVLPILIDDCAGLGGRRRAVLFCVRARFWLEAGQFPPQRLRQTCGISISSGQQTWIVLANESFRSSRRQPSDCPAAAYGSSER